MPKKKAKRKVYFGQEVQSAIIEYNLSTSDGERNIIYRDRIHKAFDKLAENIINTFKFTYFDMPFEDVKHEVVAFCVMNIHKYDHTKGSKAFSYFSIVAKNYLILHNNANYKKLKTHSDSSILNGRLHIDEEKKYDDFIVELISYFEKNIPTIFKKQRDLDIAHSILELFKRREEIENFNKKALYILIREMTDVETSSITSVVNVFKKHYMNIANEYHESGAVGIKKLNKFF